MFDELSKEQIKNIKGKLVFFKGVFDKFLSFVIFAQYVFFVPILLTKDPFTGFYVTKGYVIVGVVLSFLIFYSATRLYTVYNDKYSERFLSQMGTEESLGSKIKYIFRQKENQTEMVIFAAVYLLLPPKLLHAGFVWLFADNESGIWAKLKVSAITLPLLFLVYVLAHLSAMNYWNKEGRKQQENLKCMSDRERNNYFKAQSKEHTRFEITMFFGYFLGSMVLMFILPALLKSFSPLIGLFIEMNILYFIVILVFFPWIYRNLRALSKRRKFIKELTKLCREKKYKLSKIKDPYKSLFRMKDGENFSVHIMHRRYSCKLVAAKKRSLPLYLQKNGIATYLIKIRFLRLVLFSYTKSFKVGYEAEGKKILIINPIPQKVLFPKTDFSDMMDESGMFAVHARTRAYVKNAAASDSYELDNGDIVGDLEIYSAKSFLNALERDCIDKD